LPRSEEKFLIEQLAEMLKQELKVEELKIALSQRDDFNLIDAFSLLDRDCRSEVTPCQLN
jgi:hypothetical protein